MGKFSIVEFEDGIQLVPILWIFNGNKKCYWPNYTKQEKINQAIFNEEDPDSKWLPYNILRIFGTADTYADGIRKLKLAEQFSDIDTSGKDDTEKKLHRRERAKKRFCYTSDSEEESSVNDTDEITCKKIPPLPTLQIEKKQITSKASKKKAREQILDNSFERNNTPMTDSLFDINKNTKETLSSTSETSMEQQSSICNSDFSKMMIHKLNTIIRKVKLIDKRLQTHEEKCQLMLDRHEEAVNIIHDEELGLPLRDEFTLFILEEKLQNKEFFERMVYTLKGLGSIDVYSCTTNLLKKLFTNSLAEMYSFAGAKKKKAFQDLILYKVILKTIRVHYKDVTETEVSRFIAKWLVQAKARRERKKCSSVEENVE